jgi:hypothetical protein
MPSGMLEAATTPQLQPPQLSVEGALLPTTGREATKGAATPAPKVAPLPALCGHLPTSLVNGETSRCIPATLDSTCTVPVYKLICNCK